MDDVDQWNAQQNGNWSHLDQRLMCKSSVDLTIFLTAGDGRHGVLFRQKKQTPHLALITALIIRRFRVILSQMF